MRTRFKECHFCKISKEVLYRCKYNNSKEWIFLCGKCLNQIKSDYHDTYMVELGKAKRVKLRKILLYIANY